MISGVWDDSTPSRNVLTPGTIFNNTAHWTSFPILLSLTAATSVLIPSSARPPAFVPSSPSHPACVLVALSAAGLELYLHHRRDERAPVEAANMASFYEGAYSSPSATARYIPAQDSVNGVASRLEQMNS